jgi:hypothetical protein
MARILIAAAPFSGLWTWGAAHCVCDDHRCYYHALVGWFFMKASVPKGKAVDVAGVASHIERAEVEVQAGSETSPAKLVNGST